MGFSEQADIRAKHVQLVHEAGCLGVSYDVDGLIHGPVENQYAG